MISFGEYITYGRINMLMSMTKLASKLNLDSSTLSKIENGKRPFPKERLPELAKIFGRPIEEIENQYLNTDLKLKYGDVDFGNSKPRQRPCAEYLVTSETIDLQISRCESTATITKVIVKP